MWGEVLNNTLQNINIRVTVGVNNVFSPCSYISVQTSQFTAFLEEELANHPPCIFQGFMMVMSSVFIALETLG